MINIEQITARLAKLPDQALQQYAMMHKEDPYIMALAVSESNRRKQLRASAQAQPMEQPKVADQALMDMAPQQAAQSPDEAGLASLPTGDMNFADGGIVAFADGGDVERYNGETGSLTGGSLTGIPYADAPAGLAAVGIPAAVYKQASSLATRLGTSVSAVLARMGYDAAKLGASGVVNAGKLAASGPGSVILGVGVPATQFATDMMANNPKLREAYSDNPMMGAMDPNGALAAAILNQPRETEKAQTAATNATATSNRSALNRSEQAARANPAVYGDLPPLAGNTGLGGTKEAAALRTAKGPGTARLDAGLGAAATGKGDDYATMNVDQMLDEALKKAAAEPHPKANELKELGAAKVKAEQEEVTGLEAIHKQFDDIFKGRKDRQKGKEEDIKQMATQNLGASIFAIGAGIAAGKSLGESAEKGSKQYMAGMERINAAKDKLSDARDRLEELEAQRGEMSAREMLKARKGIKTTEIAAKEDLIKAEMDMHKVNRELAVKRVEARLGIGKTVYEQQQNNLRTKMQTDATLAAASMRDARAAAGAETKEITAAENAIARDPRAKAYMETIKAYAMQPNNPNAVKALNSLNQLRASTYKQFGITLQEAPGAPSPGGTNQQGWGIKPLQ
jgi:hypothetical protein